MVYTRAIYDTIIAWDVYISAGVAAVPSVSSSITPTGVITSIPTWWSITGRWLSARLLGGDPLRSLWVQAFIAQYCVQSAFTAGHYADWRTPLGTTGMSRSSCVL